MNNIVHIPKVKLISDQENPVTLSSKEGEMYINSGQALCAYPGLSGSAQIQFLDLPQQDPAVSGVLWHDENGFLKISLG
jgi:hypothetical protein